LGELTGSIMEVFYFPEKWRQGGLKFLFCLLFYFDPVFAEAKTENTNESDDSPSEGTILAIVVIGVLFMASFAVYRCYSRRNARNEGQTTPADTTQSQAIMVQPVHNNRGQTYEGIQLISATAGVATGSNGNEVTGYPVNSVTNTDQRHNDSGIGNTSNQNQLNAQYGSGMTVYSATNTNLGVAGSSEATFATGKTATTNHSFQNSTNNEGGMRDDNSASEGTRMLNNSTLGVATTAANTIRVNRQTDYLDVEEA